MTNWKWFVKTWNIYTATHKTRFIYCHLQEFYMENWGKYNQLKYTLQILDKSFQECPFKDNISVFQEILRTTQLSMR